MQYQPVQFRDHSMYSFSIGSGNERWCYIVTLPLIGWAHIQNNACSCLDGQTYRGLKCCLQIWLSEEDNCMEVLEVLCSTNFS